MAIYDFFVYCVRTQYELPRKFGNKTKQNHILTNLKRGLHLDDADRCRPEPFEATPA